MDADWKQSRSPLLDLSVARLDPSVDVIDSPRVA